MIRCATAASAVLLTAAAFGIDVERSAIEPRWSGASVAEWTMDYETALSQAKAERRWSLMLYTGSWWCPWCKPAEKKVYVHDPWKNYVADREYYEIEIDNPFRDGTSAWCWLFETNYVEKTGLTMDEAFAETVNRIRLQKSYSEILYKKFPELNATKRQFTLELDGFEPITYDGIDYSSLLVLAPNGELAGYVRPRVRDGYNEDESENPGRVYSEEEALTQFTNRLESIRASCAYVTTAVEPGCEGRGTVEVVDKLCKTNETVTLKATPAKGYQFAGWWLNGEPAQTEQDYRTAANKIVVRSGDMPLLARFVSVAEDTLFFDASLDLEYFAPNEAVDFFLDVESGTFPTLTVSGLPKGLSFDKKSLRIYGTPTDTGYYRITISGKNANGYQYSQVVDAMVEKQTGSWIEGENQEAFVGEEFETDVESLFSIEPDEEGVTLKSLKITGWPAGISLKSDGYTVSGKPTKAGTSVVKGVATFSNGEKQTATLFFDVYVEDSPADEFVWFDDFEGMKTGVSVAGEDVVFGYFDSTQGVTKVTGLPTGLTATTFADGSTTWFAVTGVPTKAGAYTVSVTVQYLDENDKKKTATVKHEVIVEAGASQYVDVSVKNAESAPGCTVKGGGVVAAGATSKLTASAAKGYVFAGWEASEGNPVPNDGVVDYRNPTRSVQLTEGCQTVWIARFVPVADDADILVDPECGDFEMDCETEVLEPFSVASVSLPKVKATGLPVSMTCDTVSDADGHYYLRYDPAAAKKSKKIPTPGRYAVALTASNQSGASDTAYLTITVDNWTNANIRVADDYGDYKPGVELAVDADVNPVIFLTNAVDFARGDTLKVTGLPKGLSYNDKDNAKKGIQAHTITGKPVKPGNYTLTFTAKVLGQTCQATAFITVEEFPELEVLLDEDAEKAGCSVAGVGSYICGTKVTLKAKAAAGYVFAGWTDVEGVSGLDLLNPTLSITTTADPTLIGAEFISLAEDYLFVDSLEAFPSVGTNTLVLAHGTDMAVQYKDLVGSLIRSGSLPSATVSGLPKGVKFTAKTLTLSGVCTTPGVSYVTVSAKNAGGYKFTRVLRLCVLNADGTAPVEKALVNTANATFVGFDFNLLTTGCYCDPEDGVGVALPCSEKGSAVSKVTFSKLPDGLSFALEKDVEDGSAHVSVFGTPTKPGRFVSTLSATYADRKTAKAEVAVIVEDGGSAYLEVGSIDSSLGTASKSGVYASGEKIKLTAKAASRKVFAGWYCALPDDEGFTPFSMLNELDGIDFRTAAPTFIFRPDEFDSLFLMADFVGASEDTVMQVEPEDEVWTVDPEESGDFEVALVSASLPKVTVKGLPKGFAFDAANGLLRYDVADRASLKPGVYPVTITAVNQSKASGSATVLIGVPNVESDVIGGLNSDLFAYPMNVGATISAGQIVPTVEEGWTLKYPKLPSGLSWKDGALSGCPTKSGYYTLTFEATKAGSPTETATIVLCVRDLPASAVGTFNGLLLNAKSEVAGSVAVTVASSGKITASVVRPVGTVKFTAKNWDSLTAEEEFASATLTSGGATLMLDLDCTASWTNDQLSVVCLTADGKELTGMAQRDSFSAVAEAKQAVSVLVGTDRFAEQETVPGREWTLVESETNVALTTTVAAKGSVKFAGKVAGQKISGSSVVRCCADGFTMDFVKMVGTDSVLHIGLTYDLSGELVQSGVTLTETDCQSCEK